MLFIKETLNLVWQWIFDYTISVCEKDPRIFEIFKQSFIVFKVGI